MNDYERIIYRLSLRQREVISVEKWFVDVIKVC